MSLVSNRNVIALRVVGFLIFFPFFGGDLYARYSDSELRSVENSEETQVRKLREQEIRQIRITLGRRQPQNRRADLYFRLAEIYLEAYRSAFFLEGRVYEKRLEKGSKNRTIDRGYSQPFLKKGIQACEDVLKIGIRYQKLDSVYYFLAFYHGELGNSQKSFNYFRTIVSKYPKSRFVTEAYRQIGNHYYYRRNYSRAVSSYKEALKIQSKGAPALLHKLAWSYYRTRNYDVAIQTMKKAIAQAAEDEEKFLNIKEEALRDMAIFLTERGRAEEAIEYFEDVAGGKEYYAKALQALGREYDRKVQRQKAIRVYEAILKTEPERPQKLETLAHLMELDLKLGQTASGLKRLEGLEIPSDPNADETESIRTLRALVRKTATQNHESARKQKKRKTKIAYLNRAEPYYEAYLNKFLKVSDPRGEKSVVSLQK